MRHKPLARLTALPRHEPGCREFLPRSVGPPSFGILQAIPHLDRGAASIFQDIDPALACNRNRVSPGPDRAVGIDPCRHLLGHANRPAALRRGRALSHRVRLRASASAPMLWIEESGCWFAGADGKAVRAEGIVRLENERRSPRRAVIKLSRNDALTGELNRTHLTAALAEAIEEASRYRSSFAFMLVGIDHLARINNAFGFDVADEVIGDIAKRIRARLRGGDVLGRFSGNKFGVILKNCTVDDVNVAAERFLACIREDIVPTRSGPVSVTASIGAFWPRVTRVPLMKRSTAPRKFSRLRKVAVAVRSQCGGPISSATRSAGSTSGLPTRSSPR